jgi:N-acetylglutamate synthase-like GNAT family acetyltransferase
MEIPLSKTVSESIKRKNKDFISLGAFIENKFIGYCVFEPSSGDITQIAVDKQNRRKGTTSSLLKEITRINKYDIIKAVNTDISCSSITALLKSRNIQLTGMQFDMIKGI